MFKTIADYIKEEDQFKIDSMLHDYLHDPWNKRELDNLYLVYLNTKHANDIEKMQEYI